MSNREREREYKSLFALKQIPFLNNSHIEKIKIISQRLKGEKKKKGNTL